MAIKVGSLLAELGLNSGRYTSGLKSAEGATARFKKKAGKEFRSVRRSVNNLGGGIARLTGVIAAVAGPAALGAMVKSSMSATDAQAKFASTVGVSTEALAGLQYAAELTGVKTTDLNMGLQRFTRRVAEAAQGTGEAQTAIKELGLDAVKLAEMPAEKALGAVADQMELVGSQSDKVRLAFKLFDSGGVKLLNTLEGGSAALRAYEEEAKALGITVSAIDAKRIEQTNDAMTRANKISEGLGNTLAITLSPFLRQFSIDMVESGKSTSGFKDQAASAMNGVIEAVGFMADAWTGAKLAVKVFELGARVFLQWFIEGVGIAAEASNMFGNAWNKITGAPMVAFEDTAYGKFLADTRQGILDTSDEIVALTNSIANQEGAEGLKQWAANAIKEGQAAAEEAAEGKKPIDTIVPSQEEIDEGIARLEAGMNQINSKVAKLKHKSLTGEEKTAKDHMDTMIGLNVAGNKKLAAAQQAASIAKATMTGFESMQNAMVLPWPANLVAMGQAAAIFASNVAGIKGASYEGGGFTGMGARTGGVDGRGGFPAILHPRETVVDHTRGQSAAPVNITFDITANDTQGFDDLLDSRRGQIMSMIRETMNDQGRVGIA